MGGGEPKGKKESKRCETGVEERHPQAVVVVIENMVFIARSVPLSVQRVARFPDWIGHSL